MHLEHYIDSEKSTPNWKRGISISIKSEAISQVPSGQRIYVGYRQSTPSEDVGPYEGVPTLTAARLQRWALHLSAYNDQLKFKSGVDNKDADLLSRLPIPMQMIDPNEEIYHVDYCNQLPATTTEIARETLDETLSSMFAMSAAVTV